MTASRRTRVVVTDASVLINLIHVGRLDMLGALRDWEFVVSPEVEAEVNVAPHSEALTREFEAGYVSRMSFVGMKAPRPKGGGGTSRSDKSGNGGSVTSGRTAHCSSPR